MNFIFGSICAFVGMKLLVEHLDDVENNRERPQSPVRSTTHNNLKNEEWDSDSDEEDK